jgi:hypothetical protein
VIPGKTPQKKQTMIYYPISKITPKIKQLAKILSGGRSCPYCGFNAKALGTSDTKILPKGCQLRWG